VELLNSLGFALFQQGKSKDAVVALEKALAVDPKHWKAHNNLALAAIDIGELEVAEAHYRDSLAIKPQPAIYNDLGFVLERQGLSDEAVAAYRKAIKLDPGSASAHYNLGSALARSGQFAEAERHLRSALKKSPNAQTYTGLGIVLWQTGRTDEAIANLRAAIEADPKHEAAHRTLAQVLEGAGATGEASKETETSRALKAGNPGAGSTP
jgi:Tfp pilus assembly protein PilF